MTASSLASTSSKAANFKEPYGYIFSSRPVPRSRPYATTVNLNRFFQDNAFEKCVRIIERTIHAVPQNQSFMNPVGTPSSLERAPTLPLGPLSTNPANVRCDERIQDSRAACTGRNFLMLSALFHEYGRVVPGGAVRSLAPGRHARILHCGALPACQWPAGPNLGAAGTSRVTACRSCL